MTTRDKLMNVTLILTLFFTAQAPSPALGKAQQRLAELLAPGGQPAREMLTSNLPPRKAARSLENPDLPLQSAPLPPPAPPKAEGKQVKPRPLPEDTPLVRVFNQPEAPQAVRMPDGPLVRLWSPDVNEPLPLPILGTGVRDRASLADPSLEASVAAAQAKLNPARTKPVPFQAQNLPDPFEHSQTVRLRNPPEEVAEPPLSLRPLGR
jgi:hypothetical protein